MQLCKSNIDLWQSCNMLFGHFLWVSDGIYFIGQEIANRDELTEIQIGSYNNLHISVPILQNLPTKHYCKCTSTGIVGVIIWPFVKNWIFQIASSVLAIFCNTLLLCCHKQFRE